MKLVLVASMIVNNTRLRFSVAQIPKGEWTVQMGNNRLPITVGDDCVTIHLGDSIIENNSVSVVVANAPTDTDFVYLWLEQIILSHQTEGGGRLELEMVQESGEDMLPWPICTTIDVGEYLCQGHEMLV